jgi:tetratricopeptide (TPR) repeat protein
LYLAQKDLADEKLVMKVVSLLIEMDEIDAAFQTLKKVDNSELEPYAFIAQYYHILGKDGSAIEFLQGAYHNESEPSAELILALASLYEIGDEYQNGIDIVEKALPRFPNDPKILNWYGYILVTYTDRLQESQGYLLRALELSPESQYIQDSVAWLYYKLGDYEKAMDYLKMMVEAEVRDTTVAYHAGMIYYKTGDIESALEYFFLAVNLNTDENDAIAAQNMIDELENYDE